MKAHTKYQGGKSDPWASSILYHLGGAMASITLGAMSASRVYIPSQKAVCSTMMTYSCVLFHSVCIGWPWLITALLIVSTKTPLFYSGSLLPMAETIYCKEYVALNTLLCQSCKQFLSAYSLRRIVLHMEDTYMTVMCSLSSQSSKPIGRESHTNK